jgi:hypothetical protein
MSDPRMTRAAIAQLDLLDGGERRRVIDAVKGIDATRPRDHKVDLDALRRKFGEVWMHRVSDGPAILYAERAGSPLVLSIIDRKTVEAAERLPTLIEGSMSKTGIPEVELGHKVVSTIQATA